MEEKDNRLIQAILRVSASLTQDEVDVHMERVNALIGDHPPLIIIDSVPTRDPDKPDPYKDRFLNPLAPEDLVLLPVGWHDNPRGIEYPKSFDTTVTVRSTQSMKGWQNHIDKWWAKKLRDAHDNLSRHQKDLRKSSKESP